MSQFSFGPAEASVQVFTYKEGLLSRVAHDLCLQLGKFELRYDEERGVIDAEFDASSLSVLHAMQRGVPNEPALSKRDRKQIESSITDSVLSPARFPKISFKAAGVFPKGESLQLQGQLALHGVERQVVVSARRVDGRWEASARLDQRQFGIAPFRSMLGALKIKPEVEVHVKLRLPNSDGPA